MSSKIALEVAIPNLHDCMPCELVNNKFKEITGKTQQTAEIASKHEQPVLLNSQNCRTIPQTSSVAELRGCRR
jgi:hypothetical protein